MFLGGTGPWLQRNQGEYDPEFRIGSLAARYYTAHALRVQCFNLVFLSYLPVSTELGPFQLGSPK